MDNMPAASAIAVPAGSAPSTPPIVDVLIVGGGPAGLQAALTLGRMHRSALLVDAGHGRNERADAMHNFVTREGTSPAEFRRLARRELAAYSDVTAIDTTVESVREDDLGFVADLGDGTSVRARRVLLATGVRDELPELAGVEELFGRLLHHCPFCHGHEMSGKRVGVLAGPRAAHLVPMLERIGARVSVIDGAQGFVKRDAQVEVQTADGSVVLDGVFIGTDPVPSAPHADQLGLERLPSGAIAIDLMGRTSRAGVFAAGDAAHHRELMMPASNVLASAAAGLSAAAACVADLMALDAGH
jgi:thioredoxin reductase